MHVSPRFNHAVSRRARRPQSTVIVLIGVLAWCGAVVLSGCASSGSGDGSAIITDTGPSTPPIDMLDARWPYWPDAMRIHPLTMASRDRETNEPILEARVEMTDRFGDTTKCVAQFQFELHDGAPASQNTTPMREWSVDARDPERNRVHFDKVTRTYLFRLSLADLSTPTDEFHLRVRVLSVNGRKFEHVTRVR